ncbi:DUF3558 domain-containing protein [Streptoalloteichus hindustanus]|uniref:DUF3558 domain-containing protein n=1 Tax=Streptoalloteichus hindustanus TaxID=2017 RepID=UPI0009371935|nr:DUF3558 domain-containing protein [Streptoalloteichus hindustanus]
MLAGCTSVTGGAPNPVSAASTGADPTSARQGGSTPRVSNPKKLRGADPCALLTESQLRALGLPTASRPGKSGWGEDKCTWSGDIRVTLSPDTKGKGLSEYYARQKAYDNFKSSEASGFPVVWTDFASTICSVMAGVADDQVLVVHVGSVSSRSRAQGNPCGYGETVVAEVLGNLPAGG